MRLLLVLLIAGAASFLVGTTASEILMQIPCPGEGLACDIPPAFGRDGVLIATGLGMLIFAVVSLVALNRTALLGAMLLLLTPLAAFFAVTMLEAWVELGLDPYVNLRNFVLLFVPPCLTVVVQWLVLRAQLAQDDAPAAPESRIP